MEINIPRKGILTDYLARFTKTPLPTQLIYFVTSKCNYQCAACFYWRNLNLHQNELSLEEVSKISSSFKKLSRLLISGGEPFLRPDLADICEIFYHQNYLQGIDLPTNGSLTETVVRMTELILNKCPDIPLVIGLPLDGLEETHDGLRSKPGSFKSVLETISALSKLKINYPKLSIHIISVVSRKNIAEIVPLIKFLKQNFDIDSFGPNPLRGNPKDASLLAPTGQDWLSLTQRLDPYYKYFIAKKYESLIKRHINYSFRRYLNRITARVLDGKPLPFRCRAGDAIAVLEPDGALRFCELSEPIGNLRQVNYDFKRIWFSHSAEAMRQKIKTCACTHGCFLTPSIALNPYHLLRSLITI